MVRIAAGTLVIHVARLLADSAVALPVGKTARETRGIEDVDGERRAIDVRGRGAPLPDALERDDREDTKAVRAEIAPRASIDELRLDEPVCSVGALLVKVPARYGCTVAFHVRFEIFSFE